MKGVDEWIEVARRKGLIVSERPCGPMALPVATPDEPEPESVKLLPSAYVGGGVWLLGVETRSESNQRDWRKRSGRTQKSRREVSRLFGRTLDSLVPFAAHYHGGGSLRIRFTRLAPHKLDRGNVSAALKSTEDALCLMIGSDDGSPLWLADYQQEQHERLGVRIELAIE